MQLPSLSAYLVLAYDAAKAWIWVRGAAGFPADPVEVTGHDWVIEIAALGIDLPLSEIYADIGLA